MALEQILADWGLPAILVGCMVEGDGSAFLGGVLAHRRLLPYEAAALAASAGAFLVDQSVFALGRRASGLRVVGRLLARPAVQAGLAKVARRPVLFCLGFRFVYGMKTLGALALGASSVPALRFMALDLVAAVVWGHLLTGFGYGAGEAIVRLFGSLALHRHLALAIALALAVMAGTAIARHLAGRRTGG